MTHELATRPEMEPVSAEVQAEVLEQVIMHGDLARLTPPQRIAYYRQVCDTLNLNPFTKPFQYISLQGRMTLYPTRDATDQLRRNHGISVTSVERHTDNDSGLHTVIAHGIDRHGREDTALGAISIGNLKGEGLANALMKAETKAKRRLTLSLAGLGMFDESEIGGIAEAVRVEVDDEGNVVDAGEAVEVRPITAVLADKLSQRKAAREPEPKQAVDVPGPEPVAEPIPESEWQAESESPEDAPEPVPVAPGQEALFEEPAEDPEPEARPVAETQAKAAKTTPKGTTWTGTLEGEPAEDVLGTDDEGFGFDQPTGSVGLRVKLALEHGVAMVALHGPALDDYNSAEPIEGAQVRVRGLLRLVPWNKNGEAMPPYRRILAQSVEVVE